MHRHKPPEIKSTWMEKYLAESHREPSLGDKVDSLERRCDSLENLCGEIIATLRIPQNREDIHPKLLEFAERWWDRYQHLKK